MALFGWSYASTVMIIGIVLFFIIAIIYKQLDNLGVPFNQFTGYVAGILPFLITAWLWAIKPALFIGFIGGLLGGFLGGQFLEDGGGY